MLGPLSSIYLTSAYAPVSVLQVAGVLILATAVVVTLRVPAYRTVPTP
jgi:hypothetical protein